MIAGKIMESDDFKRCERFHGHVCPGLAIGYQASIAALGWLEENRSVDEEIVVIVENDACCVDAIQVLTGCTFGKGNFIFKDHGKMAFTFFSRKNRKRHTIFPEAGSFGS
jgi:formylmethanofuran dehydrogenase subunit E